MKSPAALLKTAPVALNFVADDVRRRKPAREIKSASARHRRQGLSSRRASFRGIPAFILLVVTLLPAAGQTVTNESSPPDFMANKHPMPDQLLKDKRPDTYMVGFPAIGYDPESKFTFGAIGQIFDNGPTNSPFFRYAPYRERYAVGATASTGGNLRAFVGYDRPYLNDTPWRLRGAGLFAYTSYENYFGVGDSTLDPLTYPGSTQEYSNFDDYTDALNRNVNGQTWARYNQYRRTEGRGVVSVERDYLGGRLRPLLGLQFSYVDVHDYTGSDVDGAVQQETRLRSDYLAGRIVGFDGGWDNALKFGLTYDTRDFEPDPASGLMFQMAARVSTRALASSFNYQQLGLSMRAFHNLLAEPGRLILAGRLTYTMQFGHVPFYSTPIIPATDGDIRGLGGYATMRGYVQNRFVGEDAALANAELRWNLGETHFKKQHLRFMLVPFVDSGRVFNGVRQSTFNGWKFDGGIGFRLAWNVATIVSFDYGISPEGGLFYMELGHQF